MDAINKCFRYILEKVNKRRKSKFDYPTCIHGGMIEREIQLCYLSEISIHFS